jgi:zinc transporter
VGTAPVTEDEGLICAFQIAPLAPRTEEVLRDGTGCEGMWLHFNLSNARARRWLQEKAPISPVARATLLSAETRIHAEILPEGLVAVLTDLDHHFSGDPETFGVIRVYVDSKRLITARRRPLKTVDRLRRELAAGNLEVGSPMRLFEHFLEALAETLRTVVAKLADEVDDVEERILAGYFLDEGKALGRMRRLLAQLRRRMGADRAALAPLPLRLPPAFDAEERQGLREAIERLDAVGQDLELVQERARLLQEEIAGRLGEATNRNLYVLSIVTTTLLPITLITGVFGMNVSNLPFAQGHGGFWWVMLIMALAVIVTLIILRHRRVL